MKKFLLIILLLQIMAFSLIGCSEKDDDSAELTERIYIMNESDEVIKPTVTLKDNEFTFFYSALSSEITKGTYEIDGDKLILKTDNGQKQYVFKIDNDTLIFNANESSKLPDYANIPDGAVFE